MKHDIRQSLAWSSLTHTYAEFIGVGVVNHHYHIPDSLNEVKKWKLMLVIFFFPFHIILIYRRESGCIVLQITKEQKQHLRLCDCIDFDSWSLCLCGLGRILSRAVK